MNKKVLEQIAGTLKLDAEVLAKSLESEDSTLDLPKVYFDSDIETIKDNLGKEKYDEGAKASREITMKELSDLAGFNERVKDKEQFISKFKENILKDSSIEPNKKVEELTNSVTNLQKLLQQKDSEINNVKSEYQQKETRFKVQSLIPDLSEKIGLTKDEATSLFFMNYEIKDDGVYKDGKIVKGELENPLSLEETVNSFVSQKGWNTAEPPKGRGGQPSGGTTPKVSNLDEFNELAASKGYNVGSSQYNALLAETIKENPQLEV